MELNESPTQGTLFGKRTILEHCLFWGVIVLAVGIFWFSDRGYYHRAYNLLIALPAALAALRHSEKLRPYLSSKLFLLVVGLVLWAPISTCWAEFADTSSRTDSDFFRYALAPIWLFLATFYLAQVNSRAWLLALHIATALATISVLYFIIHYQQLLPDGYWLPPPGGRMVGYHGLYNALLTGHVIGFFLVASVALALKSNRIWWLAAFVCAVGVMLTGARTTMIASALAIAVVLLMLGKQINWKALMFFSAACLLLSIMFWDGLFHRGISVRPQIWYQAWQAIEASPWYGVGWGTPWRLVVDSVDQPFVDPHNLTLAVWRDLGLPGLVLWLGAWGAGLHLAWKSRHLLLGLLSLGLLVYGFTASMGEGASFLSRPKEHWFLVWLPLAITATLFVPRPSKASAHVATIRNPTTSASDS